MGSDGQTPPSPEREGAGIFEVNMRAGRRWSPADAYLRPAEESGLLTVATDSQVAKVLITDGRATGAELVDGRRVIARRGVILSPGAIESPA